MIIKNLLIKNYRCFGNYPSVIDFSGSGITPLIGPNNVGKSTILCCLDIISGDKWPVSRFNEDDFHNNELQNEIVIACSFFNPIPIERSSTGSLEVEGLMVRVKHLQKGIGEASIDVEYRLLSQVQNLSEEEWTIAGYGGNPNKPIYINQEIKNQLPIVITVPLIKLSYEQPTNKWSVLGRMLQKVEDDFRTLDEGSRAEEFESQISGAVGILKEPDEFQQIEQDIKSLWEEIRPANISDTELVFQEYEPWRYYRQFKISVKRGKRNVPVDNLGEGVQRLAAISIYRTYLKRHRRQGNPILLIEEPESYLHPQSRKILFSALKQAVKEERSSPGQVIYTTHSSDFMDFGELEDITLLHHASIKDEIEIRKVYPDKIRQHALRLGMDEDRFRDPKIFYEILETTTDGLKDSLFANKALLVEGPSDLELFRGFSSAEQKQIAIVSAGGKNRVPAAYILLTAFGIPTLVAIDNDEQNESNNPVSQMLEIDVRNISSVPSGDIRTINSLLVFGGKLEEVLESKLDNYDDLMNAICNEFNLPVGKNKDKPGKIRALGLLYNNEVDPENFPESTHLINNERDNLKILSDEFEAFIDIIPLLPAYPSMNENVQDINQNTKDEEDGIPF